MVTHVWSTYGDILLTVKNPAIAPGTPVCPGSHFAETARVMRGRRVDGVATAGRAAVAYWGSTERRGNKGRGRRGHFPDDDLWRGPNDRRGTQDLQDSP